MKLIQIQYFLAVADCKSVTKAAEQLYVSQPALSKQMHMLEKELGVQLMERQSFGIELTEIGKEFAKDCRVVLADLDKAVSKAVNAGKKERDIFRIGCFDGAAVEDFLPALYSNLHEKFPELSIKLQRHSVPENRKALEEDKIDMLIELRFLSEEQEPLDDSYCMKVLNVREGALIYSKQSPLAKKKNLTVSDFEKEIYLMVSGQSMMFDAGLNTLSSLGIKNPRAEEVDNFVTLMSNLDLGLGYCVLTRLVVDNNPNLLAYPLPHQYDVEVVAVWKKKKRFVSRIMK